MLRLRHRLALPSSPLNRPMLLHSSDTLSPPNLVEGEDDDNPEPEPEPEQPGQPRKRNKKRTTTTTSSRTARTLARLVDSHPRWSERLESALSASSSAWPLSKTAIVQTLRLIKSPARSLFFFRWARSRPDFLHHSDIYATVLRVLIRARRLDAARNVLLSAAAPLGDDRLYNRLVLAYGRAGLLDEALHLFQQMKSAGVRPSVVSFNTLFSVLLRRGRTQMATQLYREMCDEGSSARPDVYTFNILIRGFCLSSMVEEGFRFFKEMSRFRCSPDVVTYNTLVDGLCRAGKVRIAHNLVKGMRKKGLELHPNVVTYTTLIRGFCGKRMVADALALLDEMVSGGLRPNAITYNTLIRGLSEAGDLNKVKEILEGSGGFQPDTCTFNTLMSAHCHAGNLGEALKMFEKMSELQVHSDSATYSVLIRSLCQVENFERAEKLLEELLEKGVLRRHDGCVPLVAAYNPMFEHLCRVGKTKKAEKVFRELMMSGLQDPPAFKTLIMGHCKEGAFQDGYRLLLLMLRRGFVPDMEIYGTLINGFLGQRDSSVAYRVLEKALKSGHKPGTATFHSVLDGLGKDVCAQEAASLIMVMLERRVRQNINLSTNAVVCLFKNKVKDRAFEIIRLLYKNGYFVKLDKIAEFLCLEERFLWARELLLLNLEVKQVLDGEIYCKVVTGLCKHRKIMEGFSLFYQAVDSGNQFPLSCLETLKESLEAGQRLKEAEFISKHLVRRRQE